MADTSDDDSGARAPFSYVPRWVTGPNDVEQWDFHFPFGAPGVFAVFLTDARADMARIVNTINQLRQLAYTSHRTDTPPEQIRLPPWISGPNPGEDWDLSSPGQFRDAVWRARGNPPNADDLTQMGTTTQGVPYYIDQLNAVQRFIEDHPPPPRVQRPPPEPVTEATPPATPTPSQAEAGAPDGTPPEPPPAAAPPAPRSPPRGDAPPAYGGDGGDGGGADLDDGGGDQALADDTDDTGPEGIFLSGGTPMPEAPSRPATPFERHGEWTVTATTDVNGWKGALVIPAGSAHLTLTAEVPRQLAERFRTQARALFESMHAEAHRGEHGEHVAGELIGELCAEIGVPWWQSLLPAIARGASAIPIIGPFAGLATGAAESGLFGRDAAQLFAPPGGGAPSTMPGLPGLATLAQTGPARAAQQFIDIPGAPGGLLAALQNATPAGILGPFMGAAGMLGQGQQLVSGAGEETFGDVAEELCELLYRALRCLDCHAMAASRGHGAEHAREVLSRPPATAQADAARRIVEAALPPALHIATEGAHVGAAPPARRPAPAHGPVPRRGAPAPARRQQTPVEAARAAKAWKDAALRALQRGDTRHAQAILRGV